MESMKVDKSALVGREYLRVSSDRSGTGQSPDEQHDDNERSVTDQGWALHDKPYRDDDRSASRYARRPREGFDQLLDDLEHANLEADLLVLWESSRGSRTVGEWVRLLELCEVHTVRIWVTTHGRLYDPCNPRDRRTLLEDAVDSEYESAKTSTRIRRHARANAVAGRPHGKQLYGYQRIYDEVSRALLRVEPDPETAPIVREAARRVLGGETFYSIAKDYNQRRIPPRRSSYKEHRQRLGWTAVAIKEMLSNPAYAGLRRHKGEIAGDAIWKPLISRQNWEQLQSKFAGTRRTKDWQARHLMSGLAICDECGALLRTLKQNLGSRPDPATGKRQTYMVYVCQGAPGRTGFHVSIKAEHLDTVVTEAVVTRLERPDFLAILGEADSRVDEERQQLLTEINDNRSYLDTIRARAADERRPDLLFDQESRIQPLIDAAERKLQRLSGADPTLTRLLRSGTDVRETWPVFSLADRRQVIRAVVVPRISRSAKPGHKGIDQDRIHFQWR